MKMKSIVALAGLLGLALFSTAFVRKPFAPTTTPNTAEKESFLDFLSQFKKVELPYSIGLNDLKGYQAYRDTKAKPVSKTTQKAALSASRFLPESESGRFSRMGPPELVPIARFYPNNQMVAVVYSSKQEFSDDLYMNYRLVLYDLKGNILPKQQDKKTIVRAFNLAYSSMEKSMTCSIDANGNVSQNTYKNQWKKDVINHGYEGNKIVDFKLEKAIAFKLDNKGNISESKYEATALSTKP